MTDRVKTTVRAAVPLLIAALSAALVIFVFPDRWASFLGATASMVSELAVVLPAVLILIGLFTVYVPRSLVAEYLGRRSGVFGFFISLALGMLPTGPLYVAFPIAATLRRKGASEFNIVVFLTAWASIKLPQEIVEVQFLGLRFAAFRLAGSMVLAATTGLLVQNRKRDAKPAKEAN